MDGKVLAINVGDYVSGLGKKELMQTVETACDGLWQYLEKADAARCSVQDQTITSAAGQSNA